MIEIERKFLVNSTDFINESHVHFEIAQGYLNSNPERTVRIRIKGDKGYLTIKGKGNESGVSRYEWEKEIPLDEAKSLLQLCEKGVIEKTRYNIRKGIHVFEVDIFHGENNGLIIAEIELSNEDEHFEKPEWLGKEVTNSEKYYNAYLSQKPYKDW
jgi:adenylate cyclase